MITAYPSVSVIINTDGRVSSLAVCLESLRYLRYSNFEVVVVAGPTRDGTHELCKSYGEQIKYAQCPKRNLSMSRNIAIAKSSGEILAFIDDDAVPEPEWLEDVVPAFANEYVAVTGGFLHDHTGKAFQWKYGTMNRYGYADTQWKTAAPHLNFPYSFDLPSVIGANSIFRRSAVVEVGGFDEEYEYFLDESDLSLRCVDAGWQVAQLDRGFVHHKYMPSHIRNDAKVLTSWYSVIKNQAYFALLNGVGHTTLQDVLKALNTRVGEFRAAVEEAITAGLLPADARARFENEVEQALEVGLMRGISKQRRLINAQELRGQKSLLPFRPVLLAEEQKCFVFLTQSYPPASVGGIGRYVNHLAEGIAALGHQVHVLTSGNSHDRVDFEKGVWVHRIAVKRHVVPPGMVIPQHLWDYSRTMLGEAREIAARRNVSLVCAPIWDIEGYAFLDSEFKLVTVLQTTMAFYLQSDVRKAKDEDFMRTFGKPVMALEKQLMTKSDRVIGISHAIVEEIEAAYSFKFSSDLLSIAELGTEDWRNSTPHSPTFSNRLRLTYIGRLEARKGIDILLQIAPELLEQYPNLQIDIVGNDKIPSSTGRSYREMFEDSHPQWRGSDRLVFHGEVSEQNLRSFYRQADIVVAPSRFESFGLVHLEAMMFGKPVVGCRIGGMKEVVQHDATGLLAEPGDADSLSNALRRLLEDEALRAAFAQRSRAVFEAKFTVPAMAARVLESFQKVTGESLVHQ